MLILVVVLVYCVFRCFVGVIMVIWFMMCCVSSLVVMDSVNVVFLVLGVVIVRKL